MRWVVLAECLSVLRSLALFDEASLYSIVCEYVFVTYGWLPANTSETRVYDHIALPELTPLNDSVRFCFHDRPPFSFFDGVDVDVGLCLLPTLKSGRVCITTDESFFVSLYPYALASLGHHDASPGIKDWHGVNDPCPKDRRLLHIDLQYKNGVLGVQVAHAAPTSETDIRYMNYAIRNTRFANHTLFYPLLTTRRPVRVSVQSLN